jgi:phosphopantetheinyl transferase
VAAAILLFLELDNPASSHLEDWLETLTDADRARSRGLGPGRRRQFIAGRYLLALLMRHCLGSSPVIARTATGMPCIQDSDIRCSISHSGGGVAVGFDETGPFGVDLEALRRRRVNVLASTYFHAREAALLDALPEEQRVEAFYRLWTRKEAVAKAHGLGLTASLLAEEVDSVAALALHTFRVGGFMVTSASGSAGPPSLYLARGDGDQLRLTSFSVQAHQ